MDTGIFVIILFSGGLYLYIGSYLLTNRIFSPDGNTLQILFILFWPFFILFVIAFTILMFSIACLCDIPRIFKSPPT